MWIQCGKVVRFSVSRLRKVTLLLGFSFSLGSVIQHRSHPRNGVAWGRLARIYKLCKLMQYYTVKEAALLLKMHPQRVRQAILDLKLGAFRKGGRGAYLITQKHIDAFLVPAGAEWAEKQRK